jgi:hypothetical protein
MDTIGKRLLVNGDMSGPLTSEVFSLENIEHLSANCNYTGTPTGTLTYEISSDMGSPVNFQTLASVPVAGAAGGQIWLDRNAPYQWMRISYTPTAGVGTLNVNVIAKGDL